MLLVDDDNSSRVALMLLLEEEGFVVETAVSFADAKARIGRGTRYDLVLLDQQLGDGRGSDLLPLVREHSPGARVVLVSGNAKHATVDVSGFDAVIEKAAGFPEMLAQMVHVLG
ncbi:response regulator [Chondromyces apiculatus DSM 436]|uniref:Response regulator n=1 Tax=Chondromyces apiculatus DSM 436 TaxID=1192034 RepID=A0A017T000_9BACT|nr:response regulator [Chondromyces apiculatus DSM 436]